MRIIPIILFMSLFALLAIGLIRSDEVRAPETSSLVGQPLPALTLEAMNKTSAFKAAIGTPQIINIFASWCTPCIAELPELTQLAARNKVHLVGIVWHDTPENITQWVKKYSAPYAAIYFDTTREAGVKLGIRGIPETFVVDANGIVRLHHIGPLDATTRANTIEPLLTELAL